MKNIPASQMKKDKKEKNYVISNKKKRSHMAAL